MDYLRVIVRIETQVQGSQLHKALTSEDACLIEVSSVVSDLEALERLVSDGFKDYAKARKGPAYSVNFALEVTEWAEHKEERAVFKYVAFNPYLPAKGTPIGYADAVSVLYGGQSVFIKNQEDPSNYWFTLTPAKALRLVKDVVGAWVREKSKG